MLPQQADSRKWRLTLPEPDLGQPGDLLADLPGSIAAGLSGMVDREWLQSQNYQEQLRRADRSGASLVILDFERLLVRRMAALGVPMFAHELRRSAERQDELKAAGFSKLSDGPHEHGCAVDIIHARKGWKLSRQQWAIVGHVGQELAKQRGLKVTWGGLWTDPYDPAHWQVTGWRSWVRDEG